MTGKDCKILDIVPVIERIKKHNMLCDLVDENIGSSDEYADVSLSNINDAGKQVIKNEAANKDLSNITSAGITVIQNNAAKKDLSNISQEGTNKIKNLICSRSFNGILIDHSLGTFTAPYDCLVMYAYGLRGTAITYLYINGAIIAILANNNTPWIISTCVFFMKKGDVLSGMSANDVTRQTTCYYFQL